MNMCPIHATNDERAHKYTLNEAKIVVNDVSKLEEFFGELHSLKV